MVRHIHTATLLGRNRPRRSSKNKWKPRPSHRTDDDRSMMNRLKRIVAHEQAILTKMREKKLQEEQESRNKLQEESRVPSRSNRIPTDQVASNDHFSRYDMHVRRDNQTPICFDHNPKYGEHDIRDRAKCAKARKRTTNAYGQHGSGTHSGATPDAVDTGRTKKKRRSLSCCANPDLTVTL